MSDNGSSGMNAVVAIVAIVVIAAVAYFAVMMLRQDGPADDGALPEVNVDLGGGNGTDGQ